MIAASETCLRGTAIPLPLLPSGWQAVAYAALSDGSLAIIGTNADLRAALRRDADPASRSISALALARRALARIWTHDGERMVEGPTFPLVVPHLLFDRFPDGRWLVARTVVDPDSGERIFSPEGDYLGSIFLGDGIAHLKIDDAGHIWTGWIDKGIFGNSSWKMPDRDSPPSSSGLACFDEHGAVLGEAAPAQPPIADCYALNVVGTAAFACTYPEFPIIALGNAPEQRWPTSLSGTRAIAIADGHVLAAGGYGKDDNQLVLLKLGANQAETLASWRLPFTPLKTLQIDMPFLDGRGDKLHLVHQGIWHCWSVHDFMSR